MAELARPRLLMVTSAPHAAAEPVIELLASMGVRPASGAFLGHLDDLAAELAASARFDGTDAATPGTQAGEQPAAARAIEDMRDSLRDSLRDIQRDARCLHDAPFALAYRAPVIGTWLSTLLHVVEAVGLAPATVVAWELPASVAAGAAASALALSLARWEMTLRTILVATSGRACVVLPPAGSARIPSVLAGALMVSPPTDTYRALDDGRSDSGTRRQAPAGEHAELLPSQVELARLLVDLEGAHDELAAALPVASLWSTGLYEAERRARAAAADAATAWERTHERAFDAEVLWGALVQTSKELAALVGRGFPLEHPGALEATVALTTPWLDNR